MKITTRIEMIDSLGNIQTTDLLAGYKAAQSDMISDGSAYYGFLETDGSWYILFQTAPVGTVITYTYAAGLTNFATNWTNRTSLTYLPFNQVF